MSGRGIDLELKAGVHVEAPRAQHGIACIISERARGHATINSSVDVAI